MKISAEKFSEAGDQFLGRSYDDMDCQEFVERCMAACGLKMDLGGSNSWYREIKKNGWVGTPEECVQLFGYVPKGAILFIWEPVSASTPEKFRKDGIGDLTHMGIKTGRGDGAIHSSHSKGGVVTSKFQDKTIRNGGWNRVGLYIKFDYGKSINWFLEHAGIGSEPETPGKTEEGEKMTATVTSENGKPVNLRTRPALNAALVAKIAVGEEAEILDSTTDSSGNQWSKIQAGKFTGWMMTKYLVADDSALPPEDFDQGDLDDPDGGERIALYFTAEELGTVLPVLEKAVNQIVAKVGRG